jgi:hypothetical protein
MSTKNFSLIARIPEVTGAALTDTSGALIDSAGQMDGEAAGAIHCYVALALSRAGEALGLGAFERSTMAASARQCLIFLHEGSVLGVNINPNKSASSIEKKICDTLAK